MLYYERLSRRCCAIGKRRNRPSIGRKVRCLEHDFGHKKKEFGIYLLAGEYLNDETSSLTRKTMKKSETEYC